jgi:hypothetical protein
LAQGFDCALDSGSGKEAIDEATGYRVIKQYQRSKENIEKIAD